MRFDSPHSSDEGGEWVCGDAVVESVGGFAGGYDQPGAEARAKSLLERYEMACVGGGDGS